MRRIVRTRSGGDTALQLANGRSGRIAIGVIIGAMMTAYPQKCDAGSQADAPSSGLQSATEAAETAAQPPHDQIGEDCLGFVHATRTAPPRGANGECPTCPAKAENSEVLQFNGLQVDHVSCSGPACEVVVTIRAAFNPSKGGEITGGLVGWIAPEKRAQYAHGQTPAGQQVYRVKISYRRTGGEWRAVEFDRADAR